MAKILCPDNILEVIPPELLLDTAMKKKNQGLRLSQACAVSKDGKYELSYSFADDATMQYTTLRVVCDLDTEIPSITPFYPYAFLYENEMKELFGVNIIMINVDFQNKLYRLGVETPMLNKEDK